MYKVQNMANATDLLQLDFYLEIQQNQKYFLFILHATAFCVTKFSKFLITSRFIRFTMLSYISVTITRLFPHNVMLGCDNRINLANNVVIQFCTCVF